MGTRLCSSNRVALWRRAEEAREQRTGCVSASRVPTGFLLESPQDPATYLDEPEASQCPSFFTFPELMSFGGYGGDVLHTV